MVTDKSLLEEYVAHKDRKTFESFFARYDLRFQKRALFYIKNEEDRKDFLQDLWFDILKHVMQVKTNEEGSASAWMNVVFTHKIYDFFRKQQWDTVTLDNELLEKMQQWDALGYNNAEDQLYRSELIEKKQEILNSLPETDRKIYSLYEKHGVSIREIAQYASLNERTVRNKISMISTLLQKKLRPLYASISLLGGIMNSF